MPILARSLEAVGVMKNGRKGGAAAKVRCLYFFHLFLCRCGSLRSSRVSITILTDFLMLIFSLQLFVLLPSLQEMNVSTKGCIVPEIVSDLVAIVLAEPIVMVTNTRQVVDLLRATVNVKIVFRVQLVKKQQPVAPEAIQQQTLFVRIALNVQQVNTGRWVAKLQMDVPAPATELFPVPIMSVPLAACVQLTSIVLVGVIVRMIQPVVLVDHVQLVKNLEQVAVRVRMIPFVTPAHLAIPVNIVVLGVRVRQILFVRRAQLEHLPLVPLVHRAMAF